MTVMQGPRSFTETASFERKISAHMRTIHVKIKKPSSAELNPFSFTHSSSFTVGTIAASDKKEGEAIQLSLHSSDPDGMALDISMRTDLVDRLIEILDDQRAKQSHWFRIERESEKNATARRKVVGATQARDSLVYEFRIEPPYSIGWCTSNEVEMAKYNFDDVGVADGLPKKVRETITRALFACIAALQSDDAPPGDEPRSDERKQ
jgi:hypothetical protein